MENQTKATPKRTWDPDVQPTADQLAAWVVAHQDVTAKLTEVLSVLLEDCDRAHRCVVQNHEGLLDELGRLVCARSRYRLAWHSARRRARFAADVVDGDDPR